VAGASALDKRFRSLGEAVTRANSKPKRAPASNSRSGRAEAVRVAASLPLSAVGILLELLDVMAVNLAIEPRSASPPRLASLARALAYW